MLGFVPRLTCSARGRPTSSKSVARAGRDESRAFDQEIGRTTRTPPAAEAAAKYLTAIEKLSHKPQESRLASHASLVPSRSFNQSPAREPEWALMELQE